MRRWLVLFLTLCAGSAFAQNAVTKNNPLLDDIAAALRAHTITRGSFSQEKSLPILTQPLVSSGKFIYDANRGVLWQVEKPVSSRLMIGPTGMYQDGKLQASGGAAAMVQTIFQGLLSGDMKALQTQFNATGNGDRKHWQLTLIPRGEPLSKAIASIVLSGANEAEHLTIRELQGSVTELKLFDQNHPSALTAAEQHLFAIDGLATDGSAAGGPKQ